MTDYEDVVDFRVRCDELEAELEKSELAYVKTLRQFCEERMAAEEKVKELEARLEEATGAFKNWHLTATTAWETNRILKKQLADANARIAELEAQLARAETRLRRILPCVAEEMTYQRLMNNINQLEARAEKAEARAEAADRDIKALRNIIAQKDEIAYQSHLKAEADAERLDSINGQLQGHMRTVRDQLNNLLVDEDLTDEKLREASEGLLPNIVDGLTAALSPAEAGEGEK